MKLEFRPRFRFGTPLGGKEIAERITERLRTNNPRGLWLKNAHDHLTLNFPGQGSEAWTPQMDIDFEAVDEGRTLVRCLIGPSPSIWMLFTGGYLGLTLLGLTGITIGFVQQLMKIPMWGYVAVPVSLVGAAALFFVAHAGQHRARAEMRVLKDFLDEALGCDCFKLAEEQAQ